MNRWRSSLCTFGFLCLSPLFFFLPIIYFRVSRIFLDCARKSPLSPCPLSDAFHASLASRMSSNSLLFFLAMHSGSLSLALPSPRRGETCVPRPRAVAAPLNWIFSISLTSYCTRCHSTYGCQRSRGFFPSDLSSRATAATLRSHFFFGTADFCDPREWISF